jgi:carboxyl-terminal processing protease
MSKAVRFLLAGCIAFVLLLGSFTGGLAVGWFLPRNNPLAAALKQKTPASQDTPGNPSSQPTDQLFAPFWEAWSLVHKQYVDQPVNDLELMRGAIRGMLAALGDRHSSYMDPDQFRMLNTDLGQEYEGIGAYVDVTGEYMIIISPMPGSPAEKAGLKSGDMIIKVDGEDMTGIDGNLVLKRVLGPAGTQVTLTIARKGEQAPIDVTITRAKIKIVTTESKMLDNGIGYIKLTSFGENTNKELIKAITGIKAKNPKGLILDLRGNGGGYLDTAIQVVSQFVGKGTVVSEVYGDGQKKTEQVLPGGLATDTPLVVLVNEGSASASEITAGAIQDYGRGKLVGVKTYGKGSVQIVNTLKTDGGAVRITVAHWLTPNGRQIDKKGLEPDIEIQLSEDDIKAGKDPQLDKAIEVLLQGQ